MPLFGVGAELYPEATPFHAQIIHELKAPADPEHRMAERIAVQELEADGGRHAFRAYPSRLRRTFPSDSQSEHTSREGNGSSHTHFIALFAP